MWPEGGVAEASGGGDGGAPGSPKLLVVVDPELALCSWLELSVPLSLVSVKSPRGSCSKVILLV